MGTAPVSVAIPDTDWTPCERSMYDKMKKEVIWLHMENNIYMTFMNASETSHLRGAAAHYRNFWQVVRWNMSRWTS